MARNRINCFPVGMVVWVGPRTLNGTCLVSLCVKGTSEMKTILITMAAGREWQPISNLTAALNGIWCWENGVSLIRYSFVDTPSLPTTRPPSWVKLLLLSETLENQGGLVVWLDADAFLPQSVRVSDLDPGEGNFLTAFDQNGTNCGLVALHVGEWSEDFLVKWWNRATPDEINHVWWEQKTLHRLLNEDEGLRKHWRKTTVINGTHAAGVPVGQKLAWLQERSRS